MSEQNPKKMSVTQLTLLTAINMMGSGIVILSFRPNSVVFI